MTAARGPMTPPASSSSEKKRKTIAWHLLNSGKWAASAKALLRQEQRGYPEQLPGHRHPGFRVFEGDRLLR